MPFAVHKSLLRDQSPWFADMLQKNEQELQLEHVPKRTFRLFVAWLYAGKLVHPDVALQDHAQDGGAKEDDTNEEEPAWHDIDLASLYAFGQHYQVRRLRNDVITTIHRQHERTKRITSEAAVRLLWEVCGSNNALSRFVLQERALYGMHDRADIPAYFKTMPSSFLANVIRAAASLNGQRSRGHTIGDLPSACLWHDHGDDMGEKMACRQRLVKTGFASAPPSSVTIESPNGLKAGPRLRGECRSKPGACASDVRPSTAGTRLSRASTAVMYDGWKFDSAFFHPLYIAPTYPISPPPYALKEVAGPAPIGSLHQVRPVPCP
ncbi:hypothetical protein LTR36_010865 [Oleoguttula mirabilis]|uniref:BTB domain-containing protein n=1 Tax=Oleoguttula mirabilis TaxID=1507867 RepID=A0AAV9J452_9PEZI|nr:hypothetical protein LTR36_010865 [Oleoguttula mirabilis]